MKTPRWLAVVATGALVLGLGTTSSANSKFFPKGKFKSDGKIDFGSILVKDAKFKNFRDVKVKPGKDPKDKFKTYKADFEGKLKDPTGKKIPFKLTGSVEKLFTPNPKGKGKFDKKLLSLKFKGKPPKPSKKKLKLKASTNFPGGGSAVIGGNSRLPILTSGFFDVFFELTVDQGPPVPQTGGATRFTFQRVPEPASVMLLATGIAGFAAYRRRISG